MILSSFAWYFCAGRLHGIVFAGGRQSLSPPPSPPPPWWSLLRWLPRQIWRPWDKTVGTYGLASTIVSGEAKRLAFLSPGHHRRWAAWSSAPPLSASTSALGPRLGVRGGFVLVGLLMARSTSSMVFFCELLLFPRGSELIFLRAFPGREPQGRARPGFLWCFDRVSTRSCSSLSSTS